jgi:hypothetical protein
MVFICIALLIFIMSDLSTLKKLSRFSLCRQESIVLLLFRRSHLLTNSTTIFTFVGMGFSGIWCFHSGGFMHCLSFILLFVASSDSYIPSIPDLC